MTETADGPQRPAADEDEPLDLHTDIPHPARVYDYMLGGKDNFEADRAVAEQVLRANPNGRAGALANRAFMVRAVRYLAAEAGIRQFLDIGTGIPTSPNVHEVAQCAAAECRIAYADNDPIVLAHARALMTSSPEGRTVYIDGDMRQPETILGSPALRDVLDLSQPVGLLMIAVLHLIDDSAEAYDCCRHYVDTMAPGSHLVLTHLTDELASERVRAGASIMRQRGMTLRPRGRDAIARFFDGLDLVEPGLKIVHRWRPDPGALGICDQGYDADVSMFGAVARKPAPAGAPG